jgi:spore maturation protein CgeB
MKFVIIGLSITSSWGNGHASTYRGLVRQLSSRGHDVTFLERNVPWYAENRDMPAPPGARTYLYESLDVLRARHEGDVRDADVVIVGSYVPEGIAIGNWVTDVASGVTAFYDIDTPVTLAKLSNGGADYIDYINKALIPRYDLYLSFTGGPTLERLEREFGANMARALYCSVDPDDYYREALDAEWDLGYLGTYSDDRQPSLTELMLEPATRLNDRRFVVAGPQYPASIDWPGNVERITHLPPPAHRAFYNAQRYTLNITRTDMIRAGWSPSIRLFEAAACGTPIVSDFWEGLETFFEPGVDILIARSSNDTEAYLHEIPESERVAVGTRGRQRVMAAHTAERRAAELESFALEARRAGGGT